MPTIYTFGPFRLDAAADILFREAEPVALGQRAVALLRVLVEQPGKPVSKEALMQAAWPDLVVEESNLTVQIAALRRVLGAAPSGETWIETLPRRGYRFTGPVVAAGVAAPVATTHAPKLALPDKPSIAVLPFQNLSGDQEQEYFADGVVEDIITGLSRIKWLFVIARNSSFAYKGRALDVKQIGRDLGVRYVLEGSLRKASDRVRISVQLIEAETGGHIWAERYDRRLEDIFALQDEITLSVVGAIEPSLRDAEIERVKRKRPDSLDAYDLVLRALPHVYAATPEEASKALPLLGRALLFEADYARAHGYLAWCHEVLVRAGTKQENRVAAIHHAHAAIDHGRDDATTLALGAFAISMVEHDRVTAFEAFDQALALSPSSSFTLFLGSVAMAYAGEAERGIDWAERALRISPLDRLNYLSFHALAVGHFLRGRYEEAATAGRRAVQSTPGFNISYCLLAAPLVKLGRLAEARVVAERAIALMPSFSSRGFCVALGLQAALAEPLTEAWRAAGLPP